MKRKVVILKRDMWNDSGRKIFQADIYYEVWRGKIENEDDLRIPLSDIWVDFDVRYLDMQKIFSIYEYGGNELTHDEKLREQFIDYVKRLEEKYDVALPKIKNVTIGCSSMPFTTINFVNGMKLSEEESIYPWLESENKKSIEKYKLEIENE